MKRRLFSIVLLLLLGVARLAMAADSVRVIAAQAAIHLNADPNSLTVATVPAGTVLEVNSRQGAWYSVWLPGDRAGGSRRLGFLAASDAETADSDARGSSSAPTSPATPDETRSLPPARQRSSGDLDGFGGVTFNLPGARAVVATSVANADSGERNTLPTYGFAIGGWFGESRISGVFFDFSGVDPGSAFAQIGSNNRTDASGAIVDFHAGWQIQYPGRIRPYVLGGVGMYFQKTVITGTLNGVRVISIDQTDHFLSFVFGGGARFMVTDRWGVKVGIDALSVKLDDGYRNYGRFIGGTFFSF